MRRFVGLIVFVSILIIGSFTSCKHDPVVAIDINIDKELYDMALQDGYTWFKKSDTALPRSSGSGHGAPLLRTRFNDIASTKLDADGRVIDGTDFPSGSVIVKELLNADLSLERYAILFKDPSNQSADANGWVWGYILPGGDVSISATEKGNACIGCHSQSGNIDYMLMNKFYP
jgi:hypothetical protein